MTTLIKVDKSKMKLLLGESNQISDYRGQFVLKDKFYDIFIETILLFNHDGLKTSKTQLDKLICKFAHSAPEYECNRPYKGKKLIKFVKGKKYFTYDQLRQFIADITADIKQREQRNLKIFKDELLVQFTNSQHKQLVPVQGENIDDDEQKIEINLPPTVDNWEDAFDNEPPTVDDDEQKIKINLPPTVENWEDAFDNESPTVDDVCENETKSASDEETILNKQAKFLEMASGLKCSEEKSVYKQMVNYAIINFGVQKPTAPNWDTMTSNQRKRFTQSSNKKLVDDLILEMNEN